MLAARGFYTALMYALLPIAVAHLAWRARREPEYGEHMSERFGRYSSVRSARPLIWVHAVSVGETRAAEPLVRSLRTRHPDHDILLTHMTPTGRRAGEMLFGDGVIRAYLPFDYPAAVARFLDHYRPRAGVLLETEVWPNLVRACKARGIPLYLANARLSDKSLRRYSRVAKFSRHIFRAFTAVAAQSVDDAQRLRQLGATNVVVTGNLKFDVAPKVEQLDLARVWRERYGGRALLLAASTREGEEALLLDALALLPTDVLLVIVPRHPQRFDEVAALFEKRGIAYQRRSADKPVAADIRVLLGDSMGEMFAYYAACDVAFIGGSLLPFGGQNLIEACAVGTPVLIGPHTYNFAEAADKAIEAGAALRVDTAEALARTAGQLLADPEMLQDIGRRSHEFSRLHQGATKRAMEVLKW